MEYIVILLLVFIIGFMWVKQPAKIQGVVADALIKRLEDNKSIIAQNVYNKLPDKVKEDIPEEIIIASAEEIMDIALEVIVESLEQEKDKKITK